MTSKSNTDVDAAQAAGATQTAQQTDYGTNRTQDVDKDVGADERYEAMSADAADAWRVNGKRTYDLHQTLDMDSLLQSRKQAAKLDSLELAEREQRVRHTEAEFSQRMRHADRMDAISNSTIAAVLGDMAEKLGALGQKIK
jgi:hypothetical protein